MLGENISQNLKSIKGTRNYFLEEKNQNELMKRKVKKI